METAQITANRLLLQTASGIEVPVAIAGVGGRSLAFLIDWHIRLLLALAWLLAGLFLVTGASLGSGQFPSDSAGPLIFGVITPAIALYFLYHPVLELAMQGKTPGKRMTGIRIVNRSGHTPGAGALVMRNLFRLVDSLPMYYLVGLAAAAFSRESTRIGDIAAGTLLVYEEKAGAKQLSALLGASPALPAEWREMLADLIDRWSGLDLEVRAGFAERILDRAGRPRPQGKPKERDAQLRLALMKLLTEGS